MGKNTRLHPRKPPAPFGFIQIFGDEGGRILNISEAGLSFESFSPLGPAKTVQFWFSLNLRDRIEAMGEVVWLDTETKMGGLRFLHLTDRALRHIRAYAVDSFGSGAKRKGQLFAAALSKQQQTTLPAAPAGVESEASSERSFPRTNSAATVSLFQDAAATSPLPTALNSTDLISLQRHLQACRRKFVLGTVLGLVVASTAAVAVYRFWGPRPAIGISPPATSRQPSVPFPQDAVEVNSMPASVAKVAALPQDRSTGSSRSDLSSTGSAALSTKAHRSAAVAPSGGTDAPEAPTSASTVSRSAGGAAPKRSATPQQLWSAVQAGDSGAAVALAKRYLQGDGVPVNCLQARVLLLVASEKKNAEAIQKLGELDKSGGCPSGSAQ